MAFDIFRPTDQIYNLSLNSRKRLLPLRPLCLSQLAPSFQADTIISCCCELLKTLNRCVCLRDATSPPEPQ